MQGLRRAGIFHMAPGAMVATMIIYACVRL